MGYKPKSLYKKRKPKAKAKPKVSTAVKTYVKTTLHKAAETKQASTTLALTGFNSSIGTSDFQKLLPIITQGTSQNSRIGSEIKPIKLVIRGYFVFNSYSYPNAIMLGARMFVFQQKQIRSYANPPTEINLLDLGGDGTPYTGSALDYCTPHNNDAFYFYADKKKQVLKPYGYTDITGPTNSMTDIEPSMFHAFTITIKPGTNGFPTILKYDNSSGSNQYPTNFAPYWAFAYSNLLNFSPDFLNTQISAQFVSTLYYEDS